MRISKKMNNTNQTDFWDGIYNIGKVLAPWGTVGVICWQLINKLFKYFSDSRDAELREIVKTEMQPRIDELSRKIDNLSNIIFEMKSKM